MATYTPNYNLSKPDANDDFDAFRASYNANMDNIDNHMGGGGGGGGHTIVDPDGTDMPQETKLQFTGAVNVSDDAVNGQTVVDIEGGGNYYLNTLYSTEEKKIGYWTDNKPLYQKTWLVPKSSLNSGETTYTHGDDLHIDNLVSVEGAVANSRPLVEYHSSSAWACSIYNIGNNAFWIYLGSSVYSNMSASSYVKVTLRYTKTTDTADPNPQTGGVIYLPTIYSEEEKEVGAWTDGKPLYQKTVVIPNTSIINKDFTFAHGISNIDKVISANGMLWEIGGDSGRYSYFMPISDNSNSTLSIRVSKTDIYFRGTNYFSVDANRNMYVTIQYTKTTDTAGSGTWTPSGVPSVHYSTNEQVIGTWVDSKPLYQKTINITTPSVANTNVSVADVTSLNIDTVVSLDGNYKDTNINWSLNIYFSTVRSANCFVNGAKTAIMMLVNDNVAMSKNAYVTIKYTKTTD